MKGQMRGSGSVESCYQEAPSKLLALMRERERERALRERKERERAVQVERERALCECVAHACWATV